MKDNRAAVALRKRSTPGVGENTVQPTALSRTLNVIIVRGRAKLHVNAGRRVRVVMGTHNVDEGETPVRQHLENTSSSTSLQVRLHLCT